MRKWRRNDKLHTPYHTKKLYIMNFFCWCDVSMMCRVDRCLSFFGAKPLKHPMITLRQNWSIKYIWKVQMLESNPLNWSFYKCVLFWPKQAPKARELIGHKTSASDWYKFIQQCMQCNSKWMWWKLLFYPFSKGKNLVRFQNIWQELFYPWKRIKMGLWLETPRASFKVSECLKKLRSYSLPLL